MTKLQELTDRVYKEGVELAQKEAANIKDAAQQEADAILKSAQQKAESIISEAQRRADELRRNTESEVKLAQTQAIGAVKSSIETLISAKVAEPAVKEVFADKDFVAELIKKAAEGFASKGSGDIKVVLSEADLKALESRVDKSFKAEMSNGLTFEAGAVKSGFRIGPKDGSYFISFTEQDFAEFFKSYMRSKTAELIFGK
jgi:V/A-type H+-transporting ATPase subunit E